MKFAILFILCLISLSIAAQCAFANTVTEVVVVAVKDSRISVVSDSGSGGFGSSSGGGTVASGGGGGSLVALGKALNAAKVITNAPSNLPPVSVNQPSSSSSLPSISSINGKTSVSIGGSTSAVFGSALGTTVVGVGRKF